LNLFQNFSGLAGDTGNGTIRYKLSYDVVDAEAGLNFMVGSYLRMSGLAGLRYVRIDQRLNGEIVSTRAAETATVFGDAHADYWGIGPRLGLAGMWDIGWGFGVDAQFSGTLTVGSARLRSLRARTGAFPFQDSTEGPSSARLVPGVDATVGLSYVVPLGSMTTFKATIGYQFAHWFNLRSFAAGGEGSTSATNGLGLDGFFVRAAIKW